MEEGQRLVVERLGVSVGDEVTFTPLLLVDGAEVTSSASELSRASVKATVLGERKGPKIKGFTYKPKTNNRRSWGHRQSYHEIEVTGIDAGRTS